MYAGVTMSEELIKIRGRNGKLYFLDLKEAKRFNAWLSFCAKHLHRPRDDQFYKDFLTYLEIGEVGLSSMSNPE